ncbi:MAG TPA: class I SAM-dependent methyltransferase [Acidobacteriota bacterium]|nr:class I SAM-dependent methyltransferase [Acidobacteriota bacterium]HNT17636.1 class I SAM-dependent methyltransferase [Acidobacteriota bacterium]
MIIDSLKHYYKKEGLFGLIRRSLSYMWRIYDIPSSIIKTRIHKKETVEELTARVLSGEFKYVEAAQVPAELTSFLNMVRKNPPCRLLEIGTAKGGTLYMLSRVASDDAKIISLDMPGGRFGCGYSFWSIPLYKAFATGKQRVELVRADSHDPATLEKIKKILKGEKLDLLFIDGDHSYDGVKKDFEMYSPLVRKGGLIAFHDIVPHPQEPQCQVNRFWKEVNLQFSGEEIVSDPLQNWAGIGYLRT